MNYWGIFFVGACILVFMAACVLTAVSDKIENSMVRGSEEK